ncbi:MAG: response regulator [Acidimicrobiales bacterium]
MAHILLVDDEPDILLLIRINLEGRGHRVTVASHGEMALQMIAADPPELVVLDVMMPVMDGWGVLESLMREGVEIPVVVVSAMQDPSNTRKALELGADQHIGKPFDLRVLVGAVDLHLSRSPEERRVARAASLAALPA